MPAFPEASTIDDKLSLMTESGISRVGAATGVVSVVVTFVGFGVHGALPTDTTAEAVEIYVKGVSASQAGIGNYLELLGYLLFLAFAAYLYAVGRAGATNSLHWLNVLGLAAAITYIAVSAFAIAGQVVMVNWAKAGADPKTVLGAYMLERSFHAELRNRGPLLAGGWHPLVDQAYRPAADRGLRHARRLGAFCHRAHKYRINSELEQPNRLHGIQPLDRRSRDLPADTSCPDYSSCLALRVFLHNGKKISGAGRRHFRAAPPAPLYTEAPLGAGSAPSWMSIE